MGKYATVAISHELHRDLQLLVPKLRTNIKAYVERAVREQIGRDVELKLQELEHE